MRIGRGGIVRMPQVQHTAPALIWNHTGMGMRLIIEDANFESRAHFQVFVVLNIFMLTEEIVVW